MYMYMKKLFILALLGLCTMTMGAEDYPYLIFTNTSGTQFAFSVTNLTMRVQNNQLLITNVKGNDAFALTDLAAMQFSTADTLTGLDNVLNADAPIQVYTVLGASLGQFNNLLDAAQQLGAGSYVISDGKNSQTIIIQ